MLDLIRQCPRAQEIGEVVGQRMQLQPHGIGGEAMAGQPAPIQYTRRGERTGPAGEPILPQIRPYIARCGRIVRLWTATPYRASNNAFG